MTSVLRMCNVGLVLGFIIAAELTFGIAIGLVIAASALAGNMFTGGGSMALLIGALVALAFCLTALGAAIANLSPCVSSSGCGLFASRAFNLALGAVGTLSGLVIAISLTLPTVVVPILGTVVAIALVVMMIASASLFFGVVDQLSRFEVCRTAASSAASAIALALAVVIFLVVLIAVGVIGAEPPGGAPCVGPNC